MELEWWKALILGFVEGVTEYLPVSSTGHLLLTQRLLGMESTAATDAFVICIQVGAILAVLGLYRERVMRMVRGVFGSDEAGRRLTINVAVAFMPAAVIALLFEDFIKTYLFGEKWGTWPVVLAWFIGGAAILVVEYFRRGRRDPGGQRRGLGLDDLTWRHALIIGLIQCIAMWPGTSRSLVTIVGGVIVGLELVAAVEFSFLLGVVTLSAATAYDAVKHGDKMLNELGPGALIIGGIAAWISAALAIKWMVSYLTRHGLGIFGYYRIALAIVVAILIWNGTMT